MGCYCIIKSIFVFSLAEYAVAECGAVLPVLRAKKVRILGVGMVKYMLVK